MSDPLKIISCGDSWLYEKATGMLKCNKPIVIEMDNGVRHTITQEYEGWHVVGESMTPVCADALISILSRKHLASFTHATTCNGQQVWFREDGASYCECNYEVMTEDTKAKYRRLL